MICLLISRTLKYYWYNLIVLFITISALCKIFIDFDKQKMHLKKHFLSKKHYIFTYVQIKTSFSKNYPNISWSFAFRRKWHISAVLQSILSPQVFVASFLKLWVDNEYVGNEKAFVSLGFKLSLCTGTTKIKFIF